MKWFEVQPEEERNSQVSVRRLHSPSKIFIPTLVDAKRVEVSSKSLPVCHQISSLSLSLSSMAEVRRVRGDGERERERESERGK